MSHNASFLRALAVVTSFAAALPLAGCSTSVSGAGNGGGGATGGAGGGGDGGGGGTGGAATCASYQGPCVPGASQECGSCIPEGSSQVCGSQVCVATDGCTSAWGDCLGPNTPLVLSFDGAPVEYLADRAHTFDVSGVSSLVTDWPSARTPWLALDRDGSGSIEDGGELFGSLTRLGSGRRATNGFEALRELDADGDGRLTAADPAFARLLVWADGDGDRRSTRGELRPLAELGVVAIDLGYRTDARCDARGNCEGERAGFTYRDASGALRTGVVIDVHLATQP